MLGYTARVPTYEYECESCGHRFEVYQSIKDPPLAQCERCGGKLKRLIGGGGGFLFRGSGFYSTDYRSASYRKDRRRSQQMGLADSKLRLQPKALAVIVGDLSQNAVEV